MKADSEAYRRSQARARAMPPPAAAPGRAAMVGLGISHSLPDVARCERRWRWMAASKLVVGPASWLAAMPFTSPPAQNAPPAPVSTMQPTSSSVSMSARTRAMASSIGPDMALRRSGRFMVRTATPLSTSARRSSVPVSIVATCHPPRRPVAIMVGRARAGQRRWWMATSRVVTDRTETRTGWLAPDEIADARDRLPIIYVNAIPVRTNAAGAGTHVGLLLRAAPGGTISRAVVSGGVLYGERIRDALLRNLEKDLGAVAPPRLPLEPQPFTVAEYFPDASVTGFHDPRQHAISLAFVVAVDGDCAPAQDSLDLTWVTPEEAVSTGVRSEMAGGQDRLVRLALGHVGQLP